MRSRRIRRLLDDIADESERTRLERIVYGELTGARELDTEASDAADDVTADDTNTAEVIGGGEGKRRSQTWWREERDATQKVARKPSGLAIGFMVGVLGVGFLFVLPPVAPVFLVTAVILIGLNAAIAAYRVVRRKFG